MNEYRDFAYIRTDPKIADDVPLSVQRCRASDLAVTRLHLRRMREDGFTIHRRDAVTECIGAGVAASGRPKLMKLLRKLKPMTGLIVWSLDGLGRDPADVIKTVQLVHSRGAQVYCVSASRDDLTTCEQFKKISEAFGELFAKTTQAYRSVKSNGLGVHGARLGRPPSLGKDARAGVLAGLAAGESIASLARRYGTSRQTIMRLKSAAD